MSQRGRHLVAPAYVAMCLVLGGSAQGVWGNLLLQVTAIPLLAWSALTSNTFAHGADAKAVGRLAAAAALVILLQFIPLPPALWSSLPGREPVAEGFRLMGLELPWLPWSLTPSASIASALALLSPFAVLAAILRLGSYRAKWLATAIVLGAIAGVALGAVQVTSGRAYLYAFTSPGQAAGFFANANYMGTLLLAALPFTVALLARSRKHRDRSGRRWAGFAGMGAGAMALILLGLALSGSAAALLLSLPVMLASLLLITTGSDKSRLWLIGGAVGAAAVGCLALAMVPSLAGADTAVSVATRQEIYKRSIEATWDLFPVGGGLGSFASIYPRYEAPDAVDWVFVNHAHNDYLEIAFELGLVGIVLLIAFLIWWARRSVQIWRSPVSGAFARAATIAAAAILAHSLVDFPARTTAIAAVFAASVALMAEPRSRKAGPESEARSRPARHLTLP